MKEIVRRRKPELIIGAAVLALLIASGRFKGNPPAESVIGTVIYTAIYWGWSWLFVSLIAGWPLAQLGRAVRAFFAAVRGE